MWTELVERCEERLLASPPTDVTSVGRLLLELAPLAGLWEITREELPWGRYLVHQSERCNLQLDLFSQDYEGGVHCHDTWGMLIVVQGWMEVATWAVPPRGAPHEETVSRLGPGSGQAFCPPVSDWHKVRTGVGEQVASLHLYGPGFDMDTGTVVDANGLRRPVKRGALGDLGRIVPHLRRR